MNARANIPIQRYPSCNCSLIIPILTREIRHRIELHPLIVMHFNRESENLRGDYFLYVLLRDNDTGHGGGRGNFLCKHFPVL